MRWKISHRDFHFRDHHFRDHHSGEHDPRQVDLVALFALLVLIVAAIEFYHGRPEPLSNLAFIEPSQNVHW